MILQPEAYIHQSLAHIHVYQDDISNCNPNSERERYTINKPHISFRLTIELLDLLLNGNHEFTFS